MDDVAGLVERLEKPLPVFGDDIIMTAAEFLVLGEAASTIRAQAAEIERLRAERDHHQTAECAAEAKLREAVEVMRTLVEQRDGHFSTTEAWDRARAFLATMEKPRD